MFKPRPLWLKTLECRYEYSALHSTIREKILHSCNFICFFTHILKNLHSFLRICPQKDISPVRSAWPSITLPLFCLSIHLAPPPPHLPHFVKQILSFQYWKSRSPCAPLVRHRPALIMTFSVQQTQTPTTSVFALLRILNVLPHVSHKNTGGKPSKHHWGT